MHACMCMCTYPHTHTHTLSFLSEITASHGAPLENCPGFLKSELHSRLLAAVAASSNTPQVCGHQPSRLPGPLLPATTGCWLAGSFPSLSSASNPRPLLPEALLAQWAHSFWLVLWRVCALALTKLILAWFRSCMSFSGPHPSLNNSPGSDHNSALKTSTKKPCCHVPFLILFSPVPLVDWCLK